MLLLNPLDLIARVHHTDVQLLSEADVSTHIQMDFYKMK